MLAVHHRTVLVRTGLKRQSAVPGDGDKGPARTEHFQAVGVEIALQFFHPAEVAVDRGLNIAFGLSAIRSHDLPEHGVIGVGAEIVAHAGADRFRHMIEIAENLGVGMAAICGCS
jgi:hypothetical protein